MDVSYLLSPMSRGQGYILEETADHVLILKLDGQEKARFQNAETVLNNELKIRAQDISTN